MKLGELIKNYRRMHNESMGEFANRAKLSKTYISMLEKNYNTSTGKPVIPSIPTLTKCATAMNMTLDSLISSLDPDQIIELPMSTTKILQAKVDEVDKIFSDFPQADNIKPVEPIRVPILGKIACGNPIFENEDFQGYASFMSKVKVDFCLIAQGDSMTGARINDGDVVFIRQQPEVENGEIAAVSINDEVTLKRVYIYDTQIVLAAENLKYPPMIYQMNEIERFQILGKAVAFQSRVI